MDKILEPEIKMIIINHLLKKKLFTRNDTIINEFTIDKYSRRVDLALIKDNKFHAYEIKSSSDSLLRLKGQVAKYLEYFDKVTVITAPKHTQNALSSTPDNVAIWEVDRDYVKVIRKGKSIQISDKYKFIQLMNANELAKLARDKNISIGLQRRKVLEQNLIYLPTSTIRNYTLSFLRKRYRKNNTRFFENLHNSELSNIEDLKLLRSEINIETKHPQVTTTSSLLIALDSLSLEPDETK
jgi:hypothetical protein